MAKVTKSSKKSSVKKVVEQELTTPPVVAMPVASPKAPMLNPKLMRGALVIILIALLTYKFGPWLFPATVGYTPISRFAVWNKMETAYGTQTLDDIVNEKVLDTALAKQNVKIDQAKIDDQVKSLEKRFESVGGLDEALKQQGMTRAALNKQILTQLSVEEILKDKITPSDDEIKKEFDTNAKTVYKDKKLEDVKEEITTSLRDSKLRDAFLSWFSDVKKDIKVNNFGL